MHVPYILRIPRIPVILACYKHFLGAVIFTY